MATKIARGTKRSCQNSECGARFYDLERSPIICPICASPYVIPSSPGVLAAEEKFRRKPKRVDYRIEVNTPPETAPAGPEEALAEAEAEEPADAEEDETILEAEEGEDGGDVSNIIGVPVTKDEKEP